MPRCKEGNTFSNEDWDDCNDELINHSVVQEGPDDFTSAHQPDVLATLGAEAFGEGTDRLGDELDAWRYGRGGRSPREHKVQRTCTEARTHLQTPVESLATEDLDIRRQLEFREAVKALWSWSFRKPIEIAIGSSHITVRARRN